MQKILSNWSLRYLTPFGKVTVLKSLGLSKLSHIALVMPNPSKDMIKKIENMFFRFIWDGKSEKVRRQDAKLPYKEGGLSVPDVSFFWTAFKFSWIRRLITSNSFWPQLMLHNVSKILNRKINESQLLQLGISRFAFISSKIENPFWKQVFASIPAIVEGALFIYPEKLSLLQSLC